MTIALLQTSFLVVTTRVSILVTVVVQLCNWSAEPVHASWQWWQAGQEDHGHCTGTPGREVPLESVAALFREPSRRGRKSCATLPAG